MPTYKTTWNFVENNGSSFSEVLYQNNDTAYDAASSYNSLVNARLALLHPLNQLQSIRSSNILSTRDTAIYIYNLPGTAISTGGPLPAGACAVFQLGSAAGGTRKLWMRGLPSAWYARSNITGFDQPPPSFQVAWQAWFSALVKLGYGTIRLTPVGVGPVSKATVTQVDGTAGNGVSLVTTAVPHGLSPGEVCIIARASSKDAPALNGKYSVITTPTATTFTIAYNTPNKVVVMTPGAYVKVAVYVGTNIFSILLMNFSHYGTRTTKAPLFHSRGAKRAKRIKLSL
jgi:hypothetical protein